METYDLPETRPRRWYILTVTPQCELAVSRRLKRLAGAREDDDGEIVSDAVATFHAVARWSVRRQGRSVAMERVVFPRYLFVGFCDPVPWLDVLDVVGVQGVIGHDGAPYEIDAAIVGEIASKCHFGFYRPAAEPMVQRGMRVVARSGRFRGLEGDVRGFDKARMRAAVMTDLLGPIDVAVDEIVSVSYSERRISG